MNITYFITRFFDETFLRIWLKLKKFPSGTISSSTQHLIINLLMYVQTRILNVFFFLLGQSTWKVFWVPILIPIKLYVHVINSSQLLQNNKHIMSIGHFVTKFTCAVHMLGCTLHSITRVLNSSRVGLLKFHSLKKPGKQRSACVSYLVSGWSMINL